MSDTSLVKVASFSFPHEAHIAKASLEAAGIPAFVADENTVNMHWLYSNAMGGVRVLVARASLAEAQRILDGDYSEELEDGEPLDSCPACGSFNVAAYTKGKKPAFLVFLLLGFPLFSYQHGHKCNDCGAFKGT
ncbi:MAG: DUF2007 domain-containing protein [Alcanivoracaceae bacterium]|nr:DUF2007 domain-containing protein [Alcanivoracaceae bacterium]